MDEKYLASINESVEKLFAAMERRVSSEDMVRIRDAYHFAFEAHKDQRRKTGEPYIIHPIAVARIVAEELELGANPVIAAFLHDVVEDTPYTIEDIRQRFGNDVAFLVDVVTKKKRKKYDKSKQVDNFKQILESVQFDVRALLVKLADRLHNMRTLSSMRPDKQMKIAGETDYFYAPIANRLGLYHVKSELENLSFRYRCSNEYASIEKEMNEEQQRQAETLKVFTSKIEDLAVVNGISLRTEVRYRTLYSIWRKMQSVGCDFHHVDGKHYVRIIYNADGEKDEKKKSLQIYSVLTDYFKERPGSISNYINSPKENGYQSFHVKLLNAQGDWEEVHISSERMVRNSRLGCAAERTEKNVRLWLEKFRALLQDVAAHDELDYMDGVTASFYYDDIMAFTSKGRGVILPKGAVALDFAFEIHGEQGLHALYARINGRLASVVTELHRGDCVEIFIDDAAEPKPEWSSSVLTYKAKRYLASFFAAQPKIEYDCCPSCHPLPGDEVVGFDNGSGRMTLHKRNCKIAVRMASQQGDSIVAVDFKENPKFLYPVRINIRGVDRFHLLSDIVECITERLHLSMLRLETSTVDNIAHCTVDFSVHSVDELLKATDLIETIKNVDEVYRVNMNNGEEVKK